MSTTKTDLDHFLQLRISKAAVAEIDDALATVSQLDGLNRCRFIRCAVRYALDSIAEPRAGASQMTKHDIEFVFENLLKYEPPNFHLWLMDKTFARIDEAIEKLPTIQSREEFVIIAIQLALENLMETATLTMLGLQEESRS